MLIEYFIEVPNTDIKEPVSGFAYDLLYDMAQQFGHAQLVWYALNGNRVVEGEYTDQDEHPFVRGISSRGSPPRPRYKIA